MTERRCPSTFESVLEQEAVSDCPICGEPAEAHKSEYDDTAEEDE